MGSGGTDAQAAGMTARQVDPDMEQILASIRRIISDDQRALGMPLPDPLPVNRPNPQPQRTQQARPQQRRAAQAQAPAVPPSTTSQKVAQPVVAPQQRQAEPARTPRAAPAPVVPDDSYEAGPATTVRRPAARPVRARDDDDMEAGLHRMSARDAYTPDVDTGLPPRAAQRPPVRLAAAPPVDYRPPDVRARREEPDHSPGMIDARLAEIIRRAVSDRIDEVVLANQPATVPAYGGYEHDDDLNDHRNTAFDDGYDAPAPEAAFHEQADRRAPAPVTAAARHDSDELYLDVARHPSGSVVGVALARRSPPGLSVQHNPAGAVVQSRETLNTLVTPGTAARISGAFDALTQRVAAERARTMEETVTDMLRPMLAQWLEANLPEMVERLVSEQVALLSRREPG